jgi:hypothetical protein
VVEPIQLPNPVGADRLLRELDTPPARPASVNGGMAFTTMG